MYKLIVVDDDIFMLEQFVSGFDWESMGFKVVSAFTSASECLEYLKNNHADAILTDIFMPNISGLELAEACFKLYPNIGIVITSAYADFEYARKAIRYNVFDYILKPINDDDFCLAMSRLSGFLDKINRSNSSEDDYDSNIRIKEIFKYVNEHYGESFTAADVAAHVMINPSYLSLFFKKHTGKTFSQYVRKVRLEKACALLKNTDLKISTITERVNYKTTTHFYRHFFDEYNMTPANFRQQNKNEVISNE